MTSVDRVLPFAESPSQVSASGALAMSSRSDASRIPHVADHHSSEDDDSDLRLTANGARRGSIEQYFIDGDESAASSTASSFLIRRPLGSSNASVYAVNGRDLPPSSSAARWSRVCIVTLLLVVVALVAIAAVAVPSLLAKHDPLWNSLQQQIHDKYSKFDDRHGGRIGPGCAIGLFHNGAVRIGVGYGQANLELERYITPDNSVFRIASTSKQFTGACIAMLINQGKLALNDTLVELVPELGGYPGVTLGDLMWHTSGMPDYFDLFSNISKMDDESQCFDRDACLTEDVVLTMLNNSSPLRPPGIEFSYDNTGYFLAGVIVHRVTGLSLRDFARANLFRPLLMPNSGYADDTTMLVRGRVDGYKQRTLTECIGIECYRLSNTDLDLVGDGGVMTTIVEMQLWDENFYTHAVGGEAMHKLLVAPGRFRNGSLVVDDDIANAYYAMGLSVTDKWSDLYPFRAELHQGRFIGFTAQLLRFPDIHTSVCVLCNGGDETAAADIADDIANMYFTTFHITGPSPINTTKTNETLIEIDTK
jgi:CubicO group peptidase (beta-lactamase class C family)